LALVAALGASAVSLYYYLQVLKRIYVLKPVAQLPNRCQSRSSNWQRCL
jgi:NADH:ubiquinone oxidoreductase subunit 2 (subunit N)